jgi:hypothetical protein
MKFKDIVIVIFLSGILIYAICHRCNVLPDKMRVETRNVHQNTDFPHDSVLTKETEVHTDTSRISGYPQTDFSQASAMR